jgi:hypothetical protein
MRTWKHASYFHGIFQVLTLWNGEPGKETQNGIYLGFINNNCILLYFPGSHFVE